MREIFLNIGHKLTAVIAVLALLILNLSTYLQCGQMIINDECCHITKAIKPCCLKNSKVTLDERFTSSCGCNMREAQQPADMYNDLISGNYKNLPHSSIDLENVSQEISYINHNIPAPAHSPPISTACQIYLSNMNLRI